jgi:hypothetical protein
VISMRTAEDIKKLQRGLSSITKGWVRSLSEEVAQLEAEIAGAASQVYNPVDRGEPGAFVGFHEWAPETVVFNLDTEQDGVSSNPVNYVVRDGQEYNIEIRITGPGVFVAHYFQVQIWQRFYVPAVRQGFWYPVCSFLQYHMTAALRPWTTKFSIYPKQPQVPVVPVVDSFDNSFREMNFFWNLREPRSGRQLADTLMSHFMLLPRIPPDVIGSTNSNQRLTLARDGGFFKFATPWLFERDSQLSFLFRPITPILQFDSSLAGNNAAVGLQYDDREQGRRDQSVVVQAEVHGFRFQTTQDAIKAGALIAR